MRERDDERVYQYSLSVPLPFTCLSVVRSISHEPFLSLSLSLSLSRSFLSLTSSLSLSLTHSRSRSRRGEGAPPLFFGRDRPWERSEPIPVSGLRSSTAGVQELSHGRRAYHRHSSSLCTATESLLSESSLHSTKVVSRE